MARAPRARWSGRGVAREGRGWTAQPVLSSPRRLPVARTVAPHSVGLGTHEVPRDTAVLRGVDLAIVPGEIFELLGPSGPAKRDRRDPEGFRRRGSGSVRFLEKGSADQPPAPGPRIGFVLRANGVDPAQHRPRDRHDRRHGRAPLLLSGVVTPITATSPSLIQWMARLPGGHFVNAVRTALLGPPLRWSDVGAGRPAEAQRSGVALCLVTGGPRRAPGGSRPTRCCYRVARSPTGHDGCGRWGGWLAWSR